MANSPGVYTKEKDLTFNIQSITSNASGYVGLFRWGPVDEIVSITTNESELVQRFGQPDSITSPFFHAAANYLLYSVPLLVVRTIGAAAQNATSLTETSTLVKNLDHYETVALDDMAFVGRYPGELGNSIKVSAADGSNYAGWAYTKEFDYIPSGDQFNMVVVDVDGLISGSAGTVLERYELVSKVAGAKKSDGTTANVIEAVKRQSQYILVGDVDVIDFTVVDSIGVYQVTLAGGVDDNVVENADFVSAWDLFSNTDDVEFTRVFTSFSPLAAQIRAIDMCESRTDSVAFVHCPIESIYNTNDRVNNLVAYYGTTLNKPTSYSFQADNWKMVYDKYNDKNIWIPCDSDTAGLHARVFVNAEPWFSMAGLNRGQLKNVIKLAWSSNQAQRDVLYRYSINSIVAFKGEGTVLFGDKTALMAPSAFRHINVRTLFIVIKKAISRAARYQLFELNDFITQSLFRNATDRYLDNIKARRGIYDKRVVCDSTNNTPQVIDSNEFIGDIYVKPARSINAIKLNFIAVGTGVSFEEVEGA
jgi:hypothetical protein